MEQLTAVRPPTPAGGAQRADVRFVSGESYEIAVRGHRVLVDQPADAGGQDSAPTPTELFVGSLAACVAFYAGRYLPATATAATAWPCLRGSIWPATARRE